METFKTFSIKHGSLITPDIYGFLQTEKWKLYWKKNSSLFIAHNQKNIHYLFLYKVCKSGDQNNINRIHTLTLWYKCI